VVLYTRRFFDPMEDMALSLRITGEQSCDRPLSFWTAERS
jgi:hypothetical protein